MVSSTSLWPVQSLAEAAVAVAVAVAVDAEVQVAALLLPRLLQAALVLRAPLLLECLLFLAELPLQLKAADAALQLTRVLSLPQPVC